MDMDGVLVHEDEAILGADAFLQRLRDLEVPFLAARLPAAGASGGRSPALRPVRTAGRRERSETVGFSRPRGRSEVPPVGARAGSGALTGGIRAPRRRVGARRANARPADREDADRADPREEAS